MNSDTDSDINADHDDSPTDPRGLPSLPPTIDSPLSPHDGSSSDSDHDVHNVDDVDLRDDVDDDVDDN